MNVYDFDKTIFYPNSFVSFIKWCLIRYPKLMLLYIPKTGFTAIKYYFKKCTLTETIEQLASFVKYIPDIEKETENFWKKNEKRISKWYLEQKKDDDLIISASPEFFLKPIINKLNVNMIASQINEKTGKISGRCCYGKQKVAYLIENDFFPTNVLDNFYSDSITDTPLAYCAERAFIVKNKAQTVCPWPKINSKIKKNVLNTKL